MLDSVYVSVLCDIATEQEKRRLVHILKNVGSYSLYVCFCLFGISTISLAKRLTTKKLYYFNFL